MSSPSVRIDTLTYRLPPDLTSKFAASLEDWQAGGKVRRLWARDASLWTGSDESSWLGWLDVVKESATQLQSLKRWSEEVKSSGIRHLLLLGMGGSSLCPEVLKLTFGSQSGFPELRVLDSTDPAQVRALESKVDLQRSWFIVSSKSGTTLEPNIFKQYSSEPIRLASGLSQSPIPARNWRRWRGATASFGCSTACPALEDVTPRCQTSAWCLLRQSVWMSRRCCNERS